MQRGKFAAVGSSILLGLAILVLPNQFLFSKTVPTSFWVEYFPLPFGAGWFITFIVLFPVVWLQTSVISSVKSSLFWVFISILVAVPIALLIIAGTLSPYNLLYQYLWVSIICGPPLILQIFLRCFLCLYVKNG